MQILIDRNKNILFVADRIEFGIFDEPDISKWAFYDNNDESPKLYAIDDNFTKVIYQGEIPEDIDVWGKYMYNGTEIIPNPAYKESEPEMSPEESSRRIKQLEAIVAQLVAEKDDAK